MIFCLHPFLSLILYYAAGQAQTAADLHCCFVPLLLRTGFLPYFKYVALLSCYLRAFFLISRMRARCLAGRLQVLVVTHGSSIQVCKILKLHVALADLVCSDVSIEHLFGRLHAWSGVFLECVKNPNRAASCGLLLICCVKSSWDPGDQE